MAGFEPREVALPGGERIALRQASETDAGAMLEYLRAEAATTDQVLTQPDEFPQTIDEERAIIANHDTSGGLMMLAQAGGRLVGVLSIRPGQRRRNRHSTEFGITVAQAWRGRGVGSAMIRAMLDWCREHPFIEKVCLQVFSTNPRAVALYRALGFVEEGCQAAQAQLSPGQYADNIHMGLWVKPRG
jgi:RimJ/RimL family protein N-acetyltransferase